MATITVNGVRHEVSAPGDTPLLYVLRNDLQLSGPQFGCGLAQCGACSVLIDGKPKALNIPAELVEKVREKIEMRRRFDAAAATICRVNLKRFLKEKEDRQE